MQTNYLNSEALSFLTENYQIRMKSGSHKAREEITTLFLFNVSSHSGSLKLNAQLIDTFNDSTVVLIPEFKSMEAVKTAETVHTYLFKKEKRVFGWDIGSLQEIVGPGVKTNVYDEWRSMHVKVLKEANSMDCDITTFVLTKREEYPQLLHDFDKISTRMDSDRFYAEVEIPLLNALPRRKGSLLNTLKNFQAAPMRCVLIPPELVVGNFLFDELLPDDATAFVMPIQTASDHTVPSNKSARVT